MIYVFLESLFTVIYNFLSALLLSLDYEGHQSSSLLGSRVFQDMSLANEEQAFGHLCTDGLRDNQPSHGIVFECQVLVMKNKCLQPKKLTAQPKVGLHT